MRVVSKVRTSGEASNRLCRVSYPKGRLDELNTHENNLVLRQTQVGLPQRCDQVLIRCDDIGERLGEEACGYDCYHIEINIYAWAGRVRIIS